MPSNSPIDLESTNYHGHIYAPPKRKMQKGAQCSLWVGNSRFTLRGRAPAQGQEKWGRKRPGADGKLQRAGTKKAPTQGRGFMGCELKDAYFFLPFFGFFLQPTVFTASVPMMLSPA